ncbi:MAG: hypothetical protein IBJ03_13115 [Gemmatimonadaceae bacterium]|nr:hypothetical protein [Gemmatimonadaceae bacterium]
MLSYSASRAVLFGVLATCAVIAVPTAAKAQAVAGIGDDAIPIPRRSLRIGLGGLWNDYRDAWARTSDGSLRKAPLLASLNTDALGSTILPELASAEIALRTLTGQSNFQLSMGPFEARGEVRQSIAPITLDYGFSRRLSIKLVVPYVESRDATQFILNRNGTGANVGGNPAFGATSGVTARNINGALVTQIANARMQLSAEITRCADAMATNCDAIRAKPGEAQALLTRAQDIRTALITVYGDASRGGSPVVPITGSTLHTAITTTLGDLRTGFTSFGVDAMTSTAPSPATFIYGQAGVAAIASDSAFGVGYQRLGGTRRAGIGDVDLAATWLLWDTFKADQMQRLLAPRRGVRSTITAGWRFGTAGADRTEDAFDVPIGEGANALLLRSTTDLLINNWAWVSATVRVVRPFEDEVAVVLPARDIAGTFAGAVNTSPATRSLGQRMDFEIAPRVAVGQFFGLSAALLHRRWGADEYASTLPDLLPAGESIASAWQVPSRTFNAASFGITFSTLASYARGRSRFPAEVLYTHMTPLSASGGFVPAMSSDRLELRVYTGFPRR